MLHRLPVFSTSTVRLASTWKEIRIPVPWGHIAGKWWGSEVQRPILACHGWQDNSGTFDRLIPLLLSTKSFLAIDLPGCGLSSQIPPGLTYFCLNSVIVVKRIANHFKWPKVSLMGHSLGAIESFKYSLLFPNEVDILICLDCLKPLFRVKSKIEATSKLLDDFLKYDYINSLISEPPSYTYPELIQILHERTDKSVSPEMCKYILERNIKPSSKDSNRFYFIVDRRLRLFDLGEWSQRDIVNNSRRLTFPIFYSKVKKGTFYEKKEYTMEVVNVLKKHNKHFEMHYIDGTHHVHLNNPERLEGLINTFLRKYDSPNSQI